jgi:hypothetical protein
MAKKLKTKFYWFAAGCSWAGKLTKRDGRLVRCTHKHRSAAGAAPCVKRLRELKVGNCQNYRAVEIMLVPTVVRR